MLDKLEAIKVRWDNIGDQLSDPEIVKDQQRFKQLSKEYSDLKTVVDSYIAYRKVLDNIRQGKEILETEKDEEFREMAKLELEEQHEEKERLEAELRQMLIPKDPQDEKNVIIEIRAGTGGDEASIFAGNLLEMYTRYCEGMGWKVQLLSASEGSVGGFKEVVLEVTGNDVYGKMKYESGVHRVQRVPKTESQGRVHTSAATVAVLPEAEEVDVVLNMDDVRRDTFRASGAGGQHVNKTESAVRLTHIPSGIVVECQQERSQFQNYDRALTMLRTKLYEQKVREQEESIAQQRRTLVSSGDRSAKIRTYNYPQGRVTDHRINLTLYNLDSIMNGDIGEILEALRFAENAEKMKDGGVN